VTLLKTTNIKSISDSYFSTGNIVFSRESVYFYRVEVFCVWSLSWSIWI